jgi:hypothetical protein
MASPIEELGKDIGRVISPDLPRDLGSFDQHLDFILSKVAPHSEDLREVGFWQGKRWREIREDEGFHENLLHIFNSGGEYLLSLDGNIVKGSWRQLNDNNSIILEMGGRSELFDLCFLNNDFLVLSKHGDQARKGQRKYFMFAHERIVRGDPNWRSLMERMFNIWRENSLSIWAWVAFIAFVGIVLWLSFSGR